MTHTYTCGGGIGKLRALGGGRLRLVGHRLIHLVASAMPFGDLLALASGEGQCSFMGEIGTLVPVLPIVTYCSAALSKATSGRHMVHRFLVFSGNDVA